MSDSAARKAWLGVKSWGDRRRRLKLAVSWKEDMLRLLFWWDRCTEDSLSGSWLQYNEFQALHYYFLFFSFPFGAKERRRARHTEKECASECIESSLPSLWMT